MKNKTRVQELAEVYTNTREVNAMLDLPKDLRYNSTFLEPGCGNGNFIIEILNRKFQLVKKLQEVKNLKKLKIFDEFEFRLLLSISSFTLTSVNNFIVSLEIRSFPIISILFKILENALLENSNKIKIIDLNKGIINFII